MLKKGVIIFLLFFSLISNAKDIIDPFQKEIDSLSTLGEKLSIGNAFDKRAQNEHFKNLLKTIIEDKNSQLSDFSKVKNLSVLEGPKKKFRIFTWLIAFNDGTYDYFGFTQYFKGKKKRKKVIVSELNNNGASVNKPEYKKLNADEWIGAVYYDIVIESKKDKNYILLGWDGHNNRSSKKIIEVLSFNGKGEPVFGAPIFKMIDEWSKNKRTVTKSRIIFEFSNNVTISLRYNKQLKMIVFDHLIPPNDKLRTLKFTYVPDFSFDGFKYDDKRWIHHQDVDARNEDIVEPKKYNPADYHKEATKDTVIQD